MEKVAAYEEMIWDDILEKEALTLDEYNQLSDKEKQKALISSGKRHDALYNKKLLERSLALTTLDSIRGQGESRLKNNVARMKNLQSEINRLEPIVKQNLDKYNRSKFKSLKPNPDKSFENVALKRFKDELAKEQEDYNYNKQIMDNPYHLERIRQNTNRILLGMSGSPMLD